MTEILTVALAVFTLLITAMATLIGIIFKDLRASIAELRDATRVNGRHLDSLVSTNWQLIWRVNGLEDYAAATSGYHPPRIVGQAETGLD